MTVSYLSPNCQQVNASAKFCVNETLIHMIYLSASSCQLDIALEEDELLLPDTYISLSSTVQATIHNKSNIKSNFSWKIVDYDGPDQDNGLDVFSILSGDGIAWPGSKSQVCVLFQPHVMGSQSATIHCKIEGREYPRVLRVTGTAIGPKALFSYDMLDLQSVFINTKHQAEVNNRQLAFINITDIH